MRENRPHGSEGGEGESPSRPLLATGGCLKLPNGRALRGQSHDYRHHGTTTLFAAFEVATGKVTAAYQEQRRRVEFLDFMDEVVAAHPGRELHVILDNLNTHKKNDTWLARHPAVSFHFTPTSASWLNQVEIWFSILQAKFLRGTSFTSVEQLRPTWMHSPRPTTQPRNLSIGPKQRFISAA